MSFNKTIFSYDEAIKHYNDQNTCSSDNDCPGNSPCIGNKCIITFFCQKDDESTCALHDTEVCYKENEGKACVKDDDCSNSICNENGFCINREYICKEYSLGYFTFENAENYFNKLDIPCKYNDQCPHYTECHYDKCQSKFYCNNKDKNKCYFSRIIKDEIASVIGEYNCNKDNECVSNNCKKSYCDNVYIVKGSSYGLEDGNKCTKDSQCFSDHCSLTSGFKNICREPSDNEGIVVIFYIPFFIIIFCIFVSILSYTTCRFRRYFNEKDE